jgi:hypothetical protein
LAVKNTAIQINVTSTDSGLKSRRTDRGVPRTGVQTHENEARYVATYLAPSQATIHDLFCPPRRPYYSGSFRSRQPNLSWLAFLGQHNGYDFRAKAFPPMVIDGRSKVFEFTARTRRRDHASFDACQVGPRRFSRLIDTTVNIFSA